MTMTSTRAVNRGAASSRLIGVTTTSDENQTAAIARSNAAATAAIASALLALCRARSAIRELFHRLQRRGAGWVARRWWNRAHRWAGTSEKLAATAGAAKSCVRLDERGLTILIFYS